MAETASMKEQFPGTVFAFIKVTIKGYFKNISGNVLKTFLTSILVFLSNFIMATLIDNNALNGSPILDSLVVRPGNMVEGTSIWAVLSCLAVSVLNKVKLYGAGRLIKSIGSALKTILSLKSNFKNTPFLAGAVVSMLLSLLAGNLFISMTLFFAFLLSSAFQQKSSLIYFLRFIWSQTQKIINRKQNNFHNIEKASSLVQGCSFGFGLYIATMPFKQGIIVQIICITVLVLAILATMKRSGKSAPEVIK